MRHRFAKASTRSVEASPIDFADAMILLDPECGASPVRCLSCLPPFDGHNSLTWLANEHEQLVLGVYRLETDPSDTSVEHIRGEHEAVCPSPGSVLCPKDPSGLRQRRAAREAPGL